MTLQQTFRVAIFEEFLDSFARIPRAQQKKVNRFLRKFRDDPTSPAINYESIDAFVDPNLRTVRIDDAYRAIVLKPETGNVYVLLWVDHHDRAMRWAADKRIAIHPETGSLQVIPARAATEQKAVPEVGAGLFDHVRDRELARLGVPDDRTELVRAVRSCDELERLQENLPPEAFEALYWLAEGESLDEVEAAMAIGPLSDVDTGDFAAALERDASKRRFAVVEDDLALEAMLDAPLEKWRVFLHPSQRSLVHRTWNGPVRVLGGAGTGKSVVAVHRAAYLAEKVFTEPGDRILFTTFNRNLALDTRANLARVCSPAALARIEVAHLDEWVQRLLQAAGYAYRVAWWDPEGELGGLWDGAAAPAAGAFPPGFLRDEWELVVQAQGCDTWDQYSAAVRSGRGVRLGRAERKMAWAVFEEYRNLLERHRLREPEDALRDAKALVEQGKARSHIRSVVVDEAQDLSTHAFALLRSIVPGRRPDDLFIVGDGHQRIYRKRVVLSRAGVDIRGRGRRLRINYRTTDEIRRHALALLEDVEVDDLDAGLDSSRGYRSLMHGVEPQVIVTETLDQEVRAIADWLGSGDLSRCCLAARTNKLVERYAHALEGAAIETLRILPDTADDQRRSGLRVATMHRVKGLEFDRVVIAGMIDKAMPLAAAVARSSDDAVRREAETMERALLYVAMTRARAAVLVTAHGKPSRWLKRP